MTHVLEIDGASGQVTERPFTKDELAQQKIDEAADAAAKAAQEAAAAAAATATAAAIAHAKGLGFTDEMIAVMYPALITVAP